MIYVAAALGLTGYWLATESGLVRILIEVQAGDDGTWYPKLTALATLVVLLSPLVVLRFVLPVQAPVDPDASDLTRGR